MKKGDTAAAIADIKDLIGKLPDLLSSCKNCQDDIAAMKTWVDTFDSPDKLIQTIEKNALGNIGKIKDDVTKIKTDWE